MRRCNAKRMTMSDFYCTQCGKKSFPIWRKKGGEREVGHLKKIFCLNCKKETNFCEIKPFAQKYTYNDFLLEFKYGNFNEKGLRNVPFKQFKQILIKKEII